MQKKPASVKLYFIGIIPPHDSYNEACKLKHYFKEHYNSKASLNSPPHITLHMPFQWKEEKENDLIQKLQEFSSDVKCFNLQLSDFGRFVHAARDRADSVRDPDLLFLRRGTGRDLRDVPNPPALDLDDVGLCAGSRDLRRLCAVHLGVADRPVRLAARAHVLSDRGGDRFDDRDRDDARNCA